MEIRERLTVKEWHGSAEPPKSDEGLERRAELARATPRSNPKSGETKRRVFGVFVVLTTLVSFLTLLKERYKNNTTTRKTPTPLTLYLSLALWAAVGS